jgi:hypothetical protein
MGIVAMAKRLLQPLASRKSRVAAATVLTAAAAQYGLHVSEEMVLSVVSVGVALILGIAHEDAGLKSRAEPKS